jgi:hypothetical protein
LCPARKPSSGAGLIQKSRLPTAKNRSLFFGDLLDAKVREFNPRYEGALHGQFRHLHTGIYGYRGERIKQEVYIVRYCD